MAYYLLWNFPHSIIGVTKLSYYDLGIYSLVYKNPIYNTLFESFELNIGKQRTIQAIFQDIACWPVQLQFLEPLIR
jgi:hypothetical protein